MKRTLITLGVCIYSVALYYVALYTGGYAMEARGWRNGNKAGYCDCANQAAERGFGAWERIMVNEQPRHLPAGRWLPGPNVRFKWATPRSEPIQQ